VWAFAHGAIFYITDYDPEQIKGSVLAHIVDHKEAVTSHVSWVSLFSGFHTLGLYVHNDVMQAFGTPEKQILVEPVFAQQIQAAQGKALHGFDPVLPSSNSPAFPASQSLWLPGWSDAINSNNNSLFRTIGPGDFLIHHAIALGLHTTTLLLVKGALDARGSNLMPDKQDFVYSFPCDGPGCGGTCDISDWDAVYLAVFWMPLISDYAPCHCRLVMYVKSVTMHACTFAMAPTCFHGMHQVIRATPCSLRGTASARAVLTKCTLQKAMKIKALAEATSRVFGMLCEMV